MSRSKFPPQSTKVPQIAISEFKSKALRLLDETARQGQEYVITKKGIPIARVVPIQKPSRAPIRGSLKGIVEIHGDIVDFDTSDLWLAAEDPKADE